jgi:4-amino-4-deoxychorismate lyase
MCQLVETIKCLNGELVNLRYHQFRFNQARMDHFRPCSEINLFNAVNVPEEFSTGLYKCRVIYSREIEKIEFLPYQFRKVESLMLVEDNQIDYCYKYTNRHYLEKLFEKRGDCDDILIVKNGFISDSFAANAVFFDGQTWWTPDTPLLPGTQRARLIHEEKIRVCSITPDDLPKYTKTGLINAMLDPEEMPSVKINRIRGL